MTLLGRIAKLYYEYDYTHQQIADMIGWNRVRVTRALQEARAQGIVEITVHSDEPVFVDEEEKLCTVFGLDRAWVAPPPRTATPNELVTLAASIAASIIGDGDQVAIGVSRTLALVAEQLHGLELPAATFVPLQGTQPGPVTRPTPSNIAAAFARALGGSSHELAAPVLAPSPALYDVLRNEPSLRSAFDEACASDLALVGVGGLTPGSSVLVEGELTQGDIDQLRSAGAVGDINARFFDRDGTLVETDVTKLVVGPSLQDFHRVPRRIAVAAGPDKVEAIRGAVVGGHVTGLITDHPTALALLAEAAPGDEGR